MLHASRIEREHYALAGALLAAGAELSSVEQQLAEFDERLCASVEVPEDHELRDVLGVL